MSVHKIFALQTHRTFFRHLHFSYATELNKTKSSCIFKKFTRLTNHTYLSKINLKFHTSCPSYEMKEITKKDLAKREQFFTELTTKDKDVFLKVIHSFRVKDRLKRGHLEFIYAALRQMKDFGVEMDLEIYKKLMDVFPKGTMIAKNMIQAEFEHFARHQDCGVFLLDQMEYLGVFPDRDMGQIILSCFGISSHVYKKYCRMMYWMPKLKNVNPYLLPNPLPDDVRELARLALKKMSVDSRTKIMEYEAEELEDSVDKTWVFSAQSPVQQKLIQEHSTEKSIFVEGPYLVWLRKLSMSYYVLRADPKIYPNLEDDDNYDDVSNLSLYMFGEPKPVALTLRPQTVHEQEDGIILGMCCTGTSSKDSLLSWIRFLVKSNPKLDKIPVLFKLRSPPTSVVPVNTNNAFSEKSEMSDALKSEHSSEL